MQTKIASSRNRAFMLGGLCSISYLAVYVARNVLGTVTPQMIESGGFTTEGIGSLSSIFFITYAVGQLINGIIGDRISPKYMISIGLILGGMGNLVFTIPNVTMDTTYVSYALTGFFLSMLFAPMIRVISENTESPYTTKCALGLTVASFLGSVVAGMLAAFLLWRGVFATSSIALLIMGVVCFLLFTLWERQGNLKYTAAKSTTQVKGNVTILFRYRIILYTVIAVLTGVIRTTVVFWMPTYLSQHLGFPPDIAALIFTGASVVILMSAFLAEFLFYQLKQNMELTVLVAFSTSALCFLAVFFLANPVLNIAFLILAIMFSNCAASLLWNRYCPSLKDTGMVSSATGFLDFMSYMAASISSTLFANAVADIGWGNLILIWFGLMALGALACLLRKRNIHA